MTDYYIDGVDGDDSNLGTSAGSGNAWATIGKAFSSGIAAGNRIFVKGNGDYTETGLTLTTNADAGDRCTFIGYTSTITDGGQATLKPTSGSNIIVSSSGGAYVDYANLIFDGTNVSSHGFNHGATDFGKFWNCRFTNCGSNGYSGDNQTGHNFCEFDNNGGHGLSADTAPKTICCHFHGNTGEPIDNFGVNIMSYGTLINNSGNVNLQGGTGSSYEVAINCTWDGENAGTTVKGPEIDTSTSTPSIFINNIIYDCDTGIMTNAAAQPGHAFQNLLNSNTTDYSTDFTSGWLGWGDVTGAPGFTDEANDDYTLGSGSAAIDTGATVFSPPSS